MIMPSDGSDEVFVELDDVRFDTCRNDICEDERVLYEVRKTARKKKAKNVRSLESVL